MANIHVRDNDGNGNFTVCFHIAIPNVTNLVGVNYRAAIVSSKFNGKGASTILTVGGVGEIDAGEKTNLDSGALYEIVESISLTGALQTSPQAAVDQLNTRFTAAKAETIALLTTKLQYFGYTAGTGG